MAVAVTTSANPFTITPANRAMSILHGLSGVFWLAAALGDATAFADPVRISAPVDVGSRSQVFIDQALVKSAEGVEFRLVPARKHPTGVWTDQRKDDANPGPAGPTVLYDTEEKLFKSWATSSYNTSSDGLRWGPKEPNDKTWNHLLRVSVIKDLRDVPARRYKFTAFGPSADFPPEIKDADVIGKNSDGSPRLFWHAKGYNTFVSADGRALAHLSRAPIYLGPSAPKPPGDMITGYYDRRLERFVVLLKTGPKDEKQRTKFTSRRCFAVTTSRDFEHWSEPELVFVPDAEDDARGQACLEEVRPLLAPNDLKGKRALAHIYGVGGPIPLESCVVALLRIYFTEEKGTGPSEIQLAVSRDLKHWERPFRAPAIPRGKIGPDHASSDWDTCWFNNEGPAVEVGDEVWVYYTARNTPHDHPAGFARSQFPPAVIAEARKHVGTKYRSGTGIAVWKRDRFVAVEAGAAGGTLTTVPVVFTGSRLELNAATRPRGRVVVELLNTAGRTITRSKPFSGDQLRHPIQWESPRAVGSLVGTPVALRFQVKDAQLYAFAFR